MAVNLHVHRPLHADETGLVSISAAFSPGPDHDLLRRFSIGLHPYDVEEADIDAALLRIESEMDRASAVGECGLDTFILKGLTDRHRRLQKQIEAFRSQLSIARRHHKPVILHVVRAADQLLAIRPEFQEQTWIVHGFRGSVELARRYTEAGLLLSFGPSLADGRDPATEQAFASVDLSNLFLETDDSDMQISAVYEKAAALRQISVIQLEKHITSNFNRIFV